MVTALSGSLRTSWPSVTLSFMPRPIALKGRYLELSIEPFRCMARGRDLMRVLADGLCLLPPSLVN